MQREKGSEGNECRRIPIKNFFFVTTKKFHLFSLINSIPHNFLHSFISLSKNQWSIQETKENYLHVVWRFFAICSPSLMAVHNGKHGRLHERGNSFSKRPFCLPPPKIKFKCLTACYLFNNLALCLFIKNWAWRMKKMINYSTNFSTNYSLSQLINFYLVSKPKALWEFLFRLT